MIFKVVAFFLVLAISAPVGFAQLYMDAGRTLYEFDTSGNLITSADFDTPGHLGEGISIGPDNRVYLSVAAGTNRVDSFASNLTGQANFVANFQGGLFVPYGNVFGIDGNLFV